MKKALVSFAGGHLNDNLRTANVFDFEANPVIAGTTYLVAASSEPGALLASPGFQYFVPLGEPGLTLSSNASLVVSQTPVTSGSLPLRGLPSGTPYTGLYLDFVQSFPMLRLDVPRSLMLVVEATGGTPSARFNVSVSGADFWGQLMTATVQVEAALVATTYYEFSRLLSLSSTPKAFAYVKSAAVTAATGCPIWIGMGPSFGLDYYTPEAGLLTRVSLTGTSLNINAGGGVYIPPATLTGTPSATGPDVRGTVTVTTPNIIFNGTTNSVCIQSIIWGASAQSANVYTPALNKWTQATTQARASSLLGAPQYYLAD